MARNLRALVAIRPFYGHLHPLIPVASALAEAGHDVAFATEKSFCPVVERCGFVALPSGLDPFAPTPVGYEFSEPVTRHKVQDILRVAERWPFDLILRDPTDFAAAVVADVLGVPQVPVGFAPFCGLWWWRQILGSSLDVIRASYGLALDPGLKRLYPGLYLDTVPPWLQPSNERPVEVPVRIRPEPYQAPAPPDAVCLRELPEGPIVLVTLGTVFNRNPDLLGRLCRGARGAGAHVICTVGPNRRASSEAIDRLPGVEVVDYVPLAEILPHCAAVVAHGGYNTVLAALLHGVPLMLVPLAADNAHTAARCIELGVALTDAPDAVTDERVAELVSILLTQAQYRDAAAQLAARTRELPAPATAVPILEDLTAGSPTPARAR